MWYRSVFLLVCLSVCVSLWCAGGMPRPWLIKRCVFGKNLFTALFFLAVWGIQKKKIRQLFKPLLSLSEAPSSPFVSSFSISVLVIVQCHSSEKKERKHTIYHQSNQALDHESEQLQSLSVVTFKLWLDRSSLLCVFSDTTLMLWLISVVSSRSRQLCLVPHSRQTDKN